MFQMNTSPVILNELPISKLYNKVLYRVIKENMAETI